MEGSHSLVSLLKTFALIVGGTLVALIAFRNSLTWHLQAFWGASGDLWETLWDKVLAFFGYNDFNVAVFGSFLVTFLVYWVTGLFYTFVDLTGRPHFVSRYKIQDNYSFYPVEVKRWFRATRTVLFNQIVVGLPFGVLAHWLMRARGIDYGAKLPTFQRVLFDLIICIMVVEAGFYYSHRFMHNPKLYKRFHKKHHEWTAPIAITAVYCHPIEHVLSNLSPVFFGPVIAGSHLAIAWLWFSLAILTTLSEHSGYHLPFFPSAEFHDFHHLKFNYNYGVLGILDRLHGTDSLFRKMIQYKRHFVLLGMSSAKSIVPEEEGKKLQQS